MASKSSKIFIESAVEQEENIKNARKSLKVLQTVATNKENRADRMPAYLAKEQLATPVKLTKNDDTSEDTLKHKQRDLASTSSQTSPQITEKDLTSTKPPSAAYWEILAEKRREALVETLEENEYLHEKVEALETELNLSKLMLQQSRELVEVLTEMLQEKENEVNERAEGEGAATQYSHISEAEEADEEQDQALDLIINQETDQTSVEDQEPVQEREPVEDEKAEDPTKVQEEPLKESTKDERQIEQETTPLKDLTEAKADKDDDSK